MADRFLFQKLSSRSLLGAHVHAAAFAGAGAPATRIAPAARYINTFRCSRADAKTSRSVTEVPLVIIDRMKPGFADSVRGLKHTFSSSASNMNEYPWIAKLAAWRASCAARVAKTWAEYTDSHILPLPLVSLFFLVAAMLAPLPANGRTSGHNGEINVHIYSGCCGAGDVVVQTPNAQRRQELQVRLGCQEKSF